MPKKPLQKQTHRTVQKHAADATDIQNKRFCVFQIFLFLFYFNYYFYFFLTVCVFWYCVLEILQRFPNIPLHVKYI